MLSRIYRKDYRKAVHDWKILQTLFPGCLNDSNKNINWSPWKQEKTAESIKTFSTNDGKDTEQKTDSSKQEQQEKQDSSDQEKQENQDKKESKSWFQPIHLTLIVIKFLLLTFSSQGWHCIQLQIL